MAAKRTEPDRMKRTELAMRRNDMGWSQLALAVELDVRPYTVQRWEAGTSTPLARHRRPLAKALNVSLEELSRLLQRTADLKITVLDPSANAINSILNKNSLSSNPKYEVSHVKTLVQLRDLWGIDARAYGDANLEYQKYESLWLSNRNGLFAISSQEQVIGGFGIWPVSAEWMNSFELGEASESSLPINTPEFRGDIACQNWYISGIVLTPEYRSSYAAGILLWESTLSWVIQSNLIYPINLAAIGISTDGEKLLGRYGFELKTPADRMVDGYALYTRSLQKSDTIEMLKMRSHDDHK